MTKDYLTPQEFLMIIDKELKFLCKLGDTSPIKNWWAAFEDEPEWTGRNWNKRYKKDESGNFIFKRDDNGMIKDTEMVTYTNLNIKYDGNSFDSLICRDDLEKENK